MGLIHWSKIPITDGEGMESTLGAWPDLARELRDCRSILGWFTATAAEAAEAEDASTIGPDLGEIDFSGLDEALEEEAE